VGRRRASRRRRHSACHRPQHSPVLVGRPHDFRRPDLCQYHGLSTSWRRFHDSEAAREPVAPLQRDPAGTLEQDLNSVDDQMPPERLRGRAAGAPNRRARLAPARDSTAPRPTAARQHEMPPTPRHAAAPHHRRRPASESVARWTGACGGAAGLRPHPPISPNDAVISDPSLEPPAAPTHRHTRHSEWSLPVAPRAAPARRPDGKGKPVNAWIRRPNMLPAGWRPPASGSPQGQLYAIWEPCCAQQCIIKRSIGA
jgi:hypothetical protein